MPPPSRFNPYPTDPASGQPLPPSRFNPGQTSQTAPSALGGSPTPGPAAAAPAAVAAAPATAAPAAVPATGALLPARRLSPQETAAILRSMGGREGWNVVDSAAVPETKQGNDIKGQTVNVPTGAYTIQISDGQGNIQPVTIYPGAPIPQDDGTSIPSWIPSNTPDALPKPLTTAAANTVEMADGSRWEAQGKNPDGTTKWTQIGSGKVSNPDADRSLALKAQEDQGNIDRRRANETAGRGYLTDNEWISFQLDGEKNGLTKDQIDVTRDRYAQQKKIEDAKLQPEINEINARTGLTGAQTTLASSQANQVNANVDINQRKAGPEIEEIGSRTDLAKAQAAQARQATTIAAQPDIVNTGTGQTIYSKNPITGALTTQPNENFPVKTQADVAARMGQLQVMAQQKKQELLTRSQNDPNFNADRATTEWNSWWDEHIEGQKQTLQAAQAQAAAEEERQQAATRTAAYTAANAAGTQAISAYNAQAPRRVAPGFAAAADTLMKGGSMQDVDWRNAFVVHDVPDLNQQAQQATMDALKHISPGAAQATGQPMPNYAGVDIAAGLNRVNYGFGGVQPPAPPQQVPPQQVPPQEVPPQQVPPQGLLPPGWAGRPGFDPRLAGWQTDPYGNSSYGYGGA